MRVAAMLGLLVAALAAMAIAGTSSASAAVVCASNLDGDPGTAGIQCPNGFEYGNDNPNYAFSNGGVKVKLRAGTEAVFRDVGPSDVIFVECNKSNGSGRIADSGAADGVPNGFLFAIDWQERTSGVTSEQCPADFDPLTANVEAIETNGATAGIWDFQAAWTQDGTPPNGTMTLLDVKLSVDFTEPLPAACFYEGDADGDGQLDEGDRAWALDIDNPSNILGSAFFNTWLVESAPQGDDCDDSAGGLDAWYVLKGNTDNDGDPKFNDNLFIRENDAEPPLVNGRIAFGRSGDIYTMEPDGSDQTKIDDSGATPVYSPNGEKIAFTTFRDGNDEIYVMNADGSGATRLTNNPAIDYHPAFSPNGQQIVFASRRDGNYEIYVMDADGTDQTRLTNNSVTDDHPIFSPDGQKIVFISQRDGTGNEIYTMNADGSAPTRLTNNSSPEYDLTYSPNGQKIAFTGVGGGNIDVYTINPDGTGAAPLTSNPAQDSSPEYSPDGQKIVFESFRDGNHEIYTMNADGTGQTRLTTDPASDVFADWGAATAGPP
jgi:hypothetical protein